MAALSSNPHLDGAVLDINLQAGWSSRSPMKLTARGVRFVFATGYDHHTIPPRFDHIVRCEKPADPETVISALFDT